MNTIRIEDIMSAKLYAELQYAAMEEEELNEYLVYAEEEELRIRAEEYLLYNGTLEGFDPTKDYQF